MQAAIEQDELIQSVHERLVEMARLSIPYSEEALRVHLSEIHSAPNDRAELVQTLVDKYIADVEAMEAEFPEF